MATSGNLDWAIAEASRRAKEMNKTYIIYKNLRHMEDHIIRPSDVPGPAHPWFKAITVHAD